MWTKSMHGFIRNGSASIFPTHKPLAKAWHGVGLTIVQLEEDFK